MEQAGVISSTRVRAALDAGDIDLVARLLGRDYSLFGVVEKGADWVGKIGFPTANIPLNARPRVLPNGVYAVGVDLEGEYIDGRRQSGTRPTISPTGRIALCWRCICLTLIVISMAGRSRFFSRRTSAMSEPLRVN